MPLPFLSVRISLALLVSGFGAVAQAQINGNLIPATTYYVDQAGGSDSNPGTSSTQAFATLAKLQTVLQAGQSVAISGGSNPNSPSRYREELTIPGDRVSVIGYGVAQPLIDCSDTIAGGAWTKTPGYTNIYQATVPITSGVNGFLRMWENNVALLRPTGASMTSLDATAGTYLSSADPTSGVPISSVTLYVHTSNNDNPASNGKVYDYNARQSAIYSLSSKTLVSNVHLRRNLANEGSLKIGDDSFVSNAVLEDGIIHNTVVGEGAYWQNVHMLNSYYGGQGKIALVLNDTVATGKNATFRNVSYDESVETGGQGFFGHVNISGAFGVVSLLNCSTTGASSSIGGFDSSTTIIDGGSYDGGISIASDTKLLNLTVGGQIAIPYPNTTAEIGNVVSTGTSPTEISLFKTM
jgi:hypothetical protein